MIRSAVFLSALVICATASKADKTSITRIRTRFIVLSTMHLAPRGKYTATPRGTRTPRTGPVKELVAARDKRLCPPRTATSAFLLLLSPSRQLAGLVEMAIAARGCAHQEAIALLDD